jgi:hypothetical protein
MKFASVPIKFSALKTLRKKLHKKTPPVKNHKNKKIVQKHNKKTH